MFFTILLTSFTSARPAKRACNILTHETAEGLPQIAIRYGIRWHTIENTMVILEQHVLTAPRAMKNET